MSINDLISKLILLVSGVHIAKVFRTYWYIGLVKIFNICNGFKCGTKFNPHKSQVTTYIVNLLQAHIFCKRKERH